MSATDKWSEGRKRKLEPLLLEINKGPSMAISNAKDMALRYTVCRDMYDLAGVIQSDGRNFFKRIYWN